MRRNTKILLSIIVLLTGLFGWLFVSFTVQVARIAFAEEQTEIFEDMREQARDALAENSPNVAQAVSYLEYAYGYYPSGTKQEEGSRLDLVVERARKACVREIIGMLRTATGEDLGDSPDPWIEHYGG